VSVLHTLWLPYRLEGLCSSTRGLRVRILDVSSCLTLTPDFIVYPGMVIGEAGKAQDLYLNPCLKKQLTNIRAAAADEKIVLGSPRIMTLEECLSYMGDDEMVEVTPRSIRLRKVILDPTQRMRGKGRAA